MQHISAKIVGMEKENGQVVSIALDAEMPNAAPGQFVMVWLPGIDEKTYNVAGISPLTICVASEGAFGKMLCGKKIGDTVMVRGPYGKGFEAKGKNALLVGSGYGFAALRFFALALKKKGISATAICAAENKGLLMKEAECKTIFATMDGSEGVKGSAIDAMKKLFEKEKFDIVYTAYTCKTEGMMKDVAMLAKKHGADCRLLVERRIKCGMGICGHCCVGEKLVCCDGPVFGLEMLENPDFGAAQGKSGKVGRA